MRDPPWMAEREIDRRRFLQGALGAGALLPLSGLPGCGGLLPGAAQAGRDDGRGNGVFRHGVASGDPLADRVILWTRVTPAAEERHDPVASSAAPGPFVAVDWVLARDPALRDIVLRGSAPATAARDHTMKVDVAGLAPATTYYYRFAALGEHSAIGRTRTLPVGPTPRLRLAFASCSNIAFGHFNAYAAIARRPDLAAVLHLGDYLYEYANGTYGDGTALGRSPEPDREIVTLSDYRTRHAQYKRDPDSREMHRQHPLIAVWDDHESANDSWFGGADNHDPDAGEGSWADRKAAAMRAWREWMPVREIHADGSSRIFRSFRFGDLADLVMLDTRLVGRDRPAASPDEHDVMRDPARTLLGVEQEAWLHRQLSRSRADGTLWRILGQQVPMSTLVDGHGETFMTDKWDGYAATRDRLFDHLEREGIGDLVRLRTTRPRSRASLRRVVAPRYGARATGGRAIGRHLPQPQGRAPSGAGLRSCAPGARSGRSAARPLIRHRGESGRHQAVPG